MKPGHLLGMFAVVFLAFVSGAAVVWFIFPDRQVRDDPRQVRQDSDVPPAPSPKLANEPKPAPTKHPDNVAQFPPQSDAPSAPKLELNAIARKLEDAPEK